jgi:hypothetical protein
MYIRRWGERERKKEREKLLLTPVFVLESAMLPPTSIGYRFDKSLLFLKGDLRDK